MKGKDASIAGTLAIVLSVWAGCGHVEEGVKPTIEKVSAVVYEMSAPQTCADPCGEPLTWDFTKGLPPGGSLRRGGRLSAEGLYAVDATNMAIASGFALDKLWTPSGPFLFEAEFVPGKLGSVGAPPHEGHLWDDMAVNYVPKRTNRGFQIIVAAREGIWTPMLWAGFSNDTVRIVGPSARLTPGKPVKIALYFGANGRVVWDFAGERKDVSLSGKGPLAPSVRYRPMIGDRACSLYHPFDGVIRRVSITPCRMPVLNLELEGRQAFVRGEKEAALAMKVLNAAAEPLQEVRARVEQFVEEGRVRQTELALGTITAGAEADLACGIETRLRPGWHTLRVTAVAKTAAGGAVTASRLFRIGLGPRPADRMTALMCVSRSGA